MMSVQPDAERNRQQSPQASAATESPGALRGQVWLTVQTRQAQRLIHGRKANAGKPAIIGLVGYADRLRVIWQAARSDDPYADWWLIKVHEALARTRHLLDTEQSALNRRLAQLSALEVTVAASQQPYRIALQFANPYAFRGAQMIAEYDRYVRTVLTAQHVGFLSGTEREGLLNGSARKLRGVFSTVQDYRYLGVDREMLRQGSANASRARQLMGEVPEEVMSEQRLAPLTPRKLRFPDPAAHHLRLTPREAASPAPTPEGQNDYTGST